jgi:energy-coupling factor transporter ATP-binding protein EcfA2
MTMVTHEMGFARKVAQRVVFMDAGGKILRHEFRPLRDSVTAPRRPHRVYHPRIASAASRWQIGCSCCRCDNGSGQKRHSLDEGYLECRSCSEVCPFWSD